MQIVKMEDGTAELEIVFGPDHPIVRVESGIVVKTMNAIQSVLSIVPVEQVKCNHLDPPVGLFIHKLETTLVDGRKATYKFTIVSPIAAAKYELTIGSGAWNEDEALTNVSIKRAILELHDYCHMESFKWERK
jgi:hypothetical protein